MKKAFLTIALLAAGLTASAQGEVKDGAWEDRRVVEVAGASVSTLYLRALEALSDWAGSQEKSKMGIDVQDKDEGIVVYKGEYYLGYGKANFMYGWDTWANFTLKVRCKEGRAQVSATVPSLTFRFTGNLPRPQPPSTNCCPSTSIRRNTPTSGQPRNCLRRCQRSSRPYWSPCVSGWPRVRRTTTSDPHSSLSQPKRTKTCHIFARFSFSAW